MPHTTAPPGKSINIWKTMKAITTTIDAGTGARTPRAHRTLLGQAASNR